MGDHKDAGPPASQQIQRVGDAAHVAPVKAAGGLIEYQYPAAGKDGTGDGRALLLPAGQGGRAEAALYS